MTVLGLAEDEAAVVLLEVDEADPGLRLLGFRLLLRQDLKAFLVGFRADAPWRQPVAVAADHCSLSYTESGYLAAY